MGARLAVIAAAVGIAYAALLFHLYELQLVEGGTYLARAESQYLASGILSPTRGAIYFIDKNGNRVPAAANKDFPLVYAVPKAIEDPEETAHALAPLLNESSTVLVAQISKKDDAYELLVRKADPGLADKIQNLNIKGIYVDNAPERFYPFGSLASQLLGYVGPDSRNNGVTGHYGIEEYDNAELSGIPGGAKGADIVAAEPGSDITLTIDPTIQTEAEQVLDKLVTDYKGDSGSVIVEDPHTGKILAMGSTPDFDPNNYAQAPFSSFTNPNVQALYEPGSVFKVLTMAAGIDAGKLTPDTTYVDKGTVTLNGWTISNYDYKTHGPYGLATMTNVIEHSINTGAVFAEQKIGRDIFLSYLKKFALDEKTGVALPGEVAGDLRALNPKARDIAFATAAYGQGVAITPIELITAVGAIANGGVMMRPYVDASLSPQVIRRVVSEDTAKKVTAMMISAVDKAKVASVDGYAMAGKTGSAFIPDFVHGGYTDKLIDTYVGFGPASNPRFIVFIKITNPDNGALAALSVVPAFQHLAQFIVNYYAIPPDRISPSP